MKFYLPLAAHLVCAPSPDFCLLLVSYFNERRIKRSKTIRLSYGERKVIMYRVWTKTNDSP